MHLLVLAFALLAAAWAAIAFPGEAREQPNNIQLTSTPVNFARVSLGSERLGKLAFRGGIMLASDDERFGGFSGLAVSSDGRSLLAISDDGWWLKADLTYRADR